jgi:kynurenine formamidase
MRYLLGLVAVVACAGCQPGSGPEWRSARVIDLGALVTETLPYEVWSQAQLAQFGFNDANTFEDVPNLEPMYVVDSYYRLFNHGGPHVDAPNHVGSPENKALDDFAPTAFIGPARVLDVSDLAQGSTISLETVMQAGFRKGEVAILYTGYELPGIDGAPVYSTLSAEAARYLAELPVHAFATDALSSDSVATYQAAADRGMTRYADLLPVHHAFLTKDILIYEQLQHVDELLGLRDLFFVGVPLNIADGNGMIVRPVVFAFD